MDIAEVIGGLFIFGLLGVTYWCAYNLGYGVGQIDIISSLPEEIYCVNQTTIIEKPIMSMCNGVPKWLELVRTFNYNKTYSPDGYNCLFYSGEMATNLQNMGYNASVVTGHCVGDEYNHAWVRVCIDYEPQSGEEQDPMCREGEYV
jgi:hypothetical protein